jgi:hypothetical protein
MGRDRTQWLLPTDTTDGEGTEFRARDPILDVVPQPNADKAVPAGGSDGNGSTLSKRQPAVGHHLV